VAAVTARKSFAQDAPGIAGALPQSPFFRLAAVHPLVPDAPVIAKNLQYHRGALGYAAVGAGTVGETAFFILFFISQIDCLQASAN
jgi:hypothetical protein